MGRDLQHMHKHREIIAPLTCVGKGGPGRKWLFSKNLPICCHELFQLISTATPCGRGNNVLGAEEKLRLGEVETGPRHTATKWEEEFEPRSTCLQVPCQEPNLNPQTSPLPFSSSFPPRTRSHSGGFRLKAPSSHPKPTLGPAPSRDSHLILSGPPRDLRLQVSRPVQGA